MNLELLTKHYNEKDFALFIQSTFGIEVVEDIYRDAYLTQSERTQIDAYKFLGKTPRLSDKSILGFFSFRAKDKNIENKRVAFGDIIQTLARPYRLRHALVAIYHPESVVWRLSYVSFTIKDGELSLNTNLKRSTYVLGENIAIKTAKEQIGSLANVAITRENLENAFSVEAVTKEFYKGLVKEYENLLSHFLVYPNPDENSKKEFAIRLIGRIIFIKFLNKKSFVPDTIFELCEGYYHEKLEPLFFEQLNTSKSERKKEFVDDKIPFLNGGLFEPLNLDFYEWSGLSSRYINMLTIDDKFFEALYKHLGEYNFTVDENNGEDNDLSIDPEMLGHIFENLLAEINPETSQNARKSTGSFYTPREIVEYMVNSSLLEYLKNKTEIEEKILKTIIFENREPQEDYSKINILSAIFELKILDPACGSGAFPMGILQKLMKILTLIDDDASIWFRLQKEEFKETHKHRNKNYIRKLSIIKNSIFGVDIQPIAIEISKLRFFLSLIVEEEGEPEPLPNLEFKFACANSLLPMPFEKQKNQQTTIFNNTNNLNDIYNEIRTIKDKYFESSSSLKLDLKQEYQEAQKKLLFEIIALGDGDSSLVNYNPFDPISVAGFFDSDFMFNIKEGFDIVIGNPPYIRHEKIKELKPLLQKSSYRSYNGTADIYIYFFEQGYKLLRDNGILSYITSNKYTRAKYGKEFRAFVLANTKILEYIDFNGVKVFESATVDTSILSYQKAISEKSDFIYCDVDKSYQKGESLETFVSKKGFDYFQNDLSVESFSFANPQELAIKKRIEAIGIPLKDWDINIYRGILTGLDKAFIIEGKTKDELIAKDPKNSEIIKPTIRGKIIGKYTMEKTDRFLINTHNGSKSKNINPINIDDYPSISVVVIFQIQQIQAFQKPKPILWL